MTHDSRKKKSLAMADIVSGNYYSDNIGGFVRHVERVDAGVVTYTRPGNPEMRRTRLRTFAKWATRILTDAEIDAMLRDGRRVVPARKAWKRPTS